jgi:hypothetical protein
MPSVDLSEQYLVSFHVNPGNTVPGCCNGGLDGRALTEIRDTGVIDDMLFAYQSGTCLQSQVTSLMQGCNMSLPDAKCRCAGGSCTTDYCDPSCAHNISGKFFSCAYPKVRPTFAPSRTWTIGSFSRPTTTTGSYAQLGDTVKRAVLCSGPLSASSNLWPGGAHVIVITGWNNTWNRSSGAWIVKNSWGANWIAGGSLGSAGPGYAFVPYNGPVGEIVNWTFGVRDVRVVP